MIEYKSISKAKNESILELYDSVKWTNYTKPPRRLLKGIQNSLYILGAFKEDQLIGLIRIIGDGHTIIYIQDLLVHPKHQGKGVGKELMRKVLKRYETVRQKVLLADIDKTLNQFYQKIGFASSSNLGLTCYVRLDP